jgi:folate-dependent phosphoribosylglycinamide formyltransferase PurN
VTASTARGEGGVTRTRVALLLLDDPVYLPRVVGPMLADARVELRAAILLPPTGARSAHPGGARGARAIAARARLYGTGAFVALAAVQALGWFRALVARRSLAALARARGVEPIVWRDSVNSAQLVELIRRSGAEVVLGVFSERAGEGLRRATAGGLVLLHYSMLPRFAGREPTFWTLLEDPEAGGVTFFLADDALDAGRVAASAACGLGGARSLHEAITRLSDAAGAIAADAVRRAARGEVDAPVRGDARRYGWPSPSDVRAFRARGLRFV